MSDDFRVTPRRAPYEADAKTALATGIVAVLLLWPFGILLGPLAIWSGMSARRRIQAAGGKLAGDQLALAGMVIGSGVCGVCALLVLAEVGAFLSTGSLIPAP